jgi:hypothetical protein
VQDKPDSIRCGEDWVWSAKVQSGKWYHIRIWAKLNTPGKRDGRFKAWLDGDMVLDKDDIPYRYDEDFKISRAYLTTYAGTGPCMYAHRYVQLHENIHNKNTDISRHLGTLRYVSML